MGLYFYVIRTTENRNIECYAEVSNCDGYDLVCRDGSFGKGNKSSGYLKIPDGSCEIIVLRPIDNKCRYGSLFSNGSYYEEVNLLTSQEREIHAFLLNKQMFVDLANVEKNPTI
jgi:hypothetical protein